MTPAEPLSSAAPPAPHRIFRIAGRPVATLWCSGRLDWAEDTRCPGPNHAGRDASPRLLAALERLVAEALRDNAEGPITIDAGQGDASGQR